MNQTINAFDHKSFMVECLLDDNFLYFSFLFLWTATPGLLRSNGKTGIKSK